MGHEGWADAMAPGGEGRLGEGRAASSAPSPLRPRVGHRLRVRQHKPLVSPSPILHRVISCFFTDGFVPLRLPLR